ncbi:exodeoxyribonuclease V subunit gamma [Nocardioides panacisoli]|uniref:exodeoxyribonuclease V subunit gamma n=1 Tax=Nocardioides panacisoli TaxID=627624 RepID=UPI001C626621|nr:exodeoxyribonuclease V subunit gamma [Nocardioides panacisoli]QYJ03045.1 exodeoxyribonuclease V subunit gamma [Nocardioides panacisoli]
MGLHLHRATRTDHLADGLGAVLAEPLADPFASEVVVVPAKGVERWLSQRLSHRLDPDGRDGICAGVDFRSPRWLARELLGIGEDDPWDPEALTWPLLAVIDASLDEPWAATLATHLGHHHSGEEAELRRGRRFATAQRLARLLASYAVQRPRLLADWSAGRDTDGLDRDLPADLAWQPELWRRLVAAVGEPDPVQRHAEAVRRLREGAAAVDLPERISLFGHTRLPRTEIELLDALATQREVHLWLPHPSPALWSALAGVDTAVPRAEDRSHEAVGHPLLASLGRDVRELQRTLGTVGADAPDESGRARPPVVEPVETLLGWLQADLRANAVGDATARPLDRERDRSVQVHACHGPARQVEVLRESLLGLFEDDPTLEPRDVVVMCPDIETYAPLLAAGFGLGEVVGDDGHPAHQLRLKLADRALDRTNPLLAIALRLLDLAGGRAGVGDVLDLAHADPVRRRFGFRDDDLQLLTTWAAEAGVRWGFDAAHRAEYGLEAYVANTWQFGLDRMLAGAAMSADTGTWLDRTLPLDDVGSGEVELVGRLTEFVHRLREVTDLLTGAHPREHWVHHLHEGIVALASVPPRDHWQLAQVQRELARGTRERATEGAEATELRLPDVRAMLGDRLQGRPTRANFRTGAMTVCTMTPMRSVPHRVVALLGLDDGVFPRVGITDGDDVLARDPVTGERDVRNEDRQLLLDAIAAATDHLVITYTGANEYSGQERPPAPPLGELLDALDATAHHPEGTVSRAVTARHPLQPFDRRNLLPGALVPGEAFSFDRAALRGARAAAGPRVQPPRLLAGPLPPAPPEDVALEDLLAFFRSPVRGFLRDRLDLTLPREEERLDDALPVEVDALVKWAVGDRVVRDLLGGLDPEQAKQQEWRRGVLPPRQLGWRILGEVLGQARPIAAEGLRLRTRQATAVDVEVDLGGGRMLRGTVPEVFGDRLVPVHFGRLNAGHRLQSWIQLLALAAGDEDRAWTACTVGRAGGRAESPVTTSLLGPLDHTARDLLRDLVELRDRGLREPLPLPLKTSLAYARKRRTRVDAPQALSDVTRFEWSDGRFPGEQSQDEHVRVWGPRADLPGADRAPEPGEEQPAEETRFGALALRLWGPLLTSEQGSW